MLSDHLPCCSNLVPQYCFFTLSGRTYMMPFLKPSLHETYQDKFRKRQDHMKKAIASPPCGIRPRSLHFSGKDNQKVSKRTTKPNQNMSKRENYPRKYWVIERKPALQCRALFLLPPQTLALEEQCFPHHNTKQLSELGAVQLLLTAELVTQGCARIPMS